jgi:hypothetical protein
VIEGTFLGSRITTSDVLELTSLGRTLKEDSDEADLPTVLY